jgi:hypothetical protein
MSKREIEQLLELVDRCCVAFDQHYNGANATVKLHTDDYGVWNRVWE